METDVSMYAELVADDDLKDFRFRVPASLKDRWQRMIDDRRLGVQDGFEALMESVLKMDDLTQAMLFQQVEPSPDLVRIVLSQLAAEKNIHLKGVVSGRDQGRAAGQSEASRGGERLEGPAQRRKQEKNGK